MKCGEVEVIERNSQARKQPSLCCIIGIVILLLVAVLVTYLTCPLDYCVTISGIRNGSQSQNNSILAKIGEAYYEIDSTVEFAEHLAFSEWEEIAYKPSGDPVILLQFAELWVVEMYDTGYVAAYNGYASIGKRSSAYYKVPANVAKLVICYFENNGTNHELGDGTIGLTSFKH